MAVPGEDRIRAGLLTAHLTRSGGGVFTAVRDLAAHLSTQPALDIDVLGPGDSAAIAPEWPGVTVHASPVIGPRSFGYARGLNDFVAARNPALIHLHGLWTYPSLAATTFTWRTKRPHLISPHGMLDPWALKNSALKKSIAATLFERRNIETAACLHALNDAEAHAIRQYGYQGPIAVIPNGIDVPTGGMPPSPRPQQLNPGRKTLLFLGRIHPKKGLPQLVCTWGSLDRKLRDEWRLVIAGWDERGHQRKLKAVADRFGIEEDSLCFTGPLFDDEKRAALAHCSGFILPSLSEGQPMAVLEAWSYGKPVLMTPACNLPEGFQSAAAMKLEIDPEIFARTLTDFLALPDSARAAIGANGLALVRQSFSWPRIAAEFATLYQWLTARAAQPSCVISS